MIYVRPGDMVVDTTRTKVFGYFKDRFEVGTGVYFNMMIRPNYRPVMNDYEYEDSINFRVSKAELELVLNTPDTKVFSIRFGEPLTFDNAKRMLEDPQPDDPHNFYHDFWSERDYKHVRHVEFARRARSYMDSPEKSRSWLDIPM